MKPLVAESDNGVILPRIHHRNSTGPTIIFGIFGIFGKNQGIFGISLGIFGKNQGIFDVFAWSAVCAVFATFGIFGIFEKNQGIFGISLGIFGKNQGIFGVLARSALPSLTPLVCLASLEKSKESLALVWAPLEKIK